MKEIKLTVGELREMLELLPEDSELIFSCQQANAVLGFRRLHGLGEKAVQFVFGTKECHDDNAYQHSIAS